MRWVMRVVAALLVILFAVNVACATAYAYVGVGNASAGAVAEAGGGSNATCGPLQPVCDFFKELVDSAVSSVESFVNGFVNGLVRRAGSVGRELAGGVADAYASLAFRVPVFASPNVSGVPYTVVFRAMDDIYSSAVWLAYGLLALLLVIAAVSLMLEGGLLREGEAAAALKRSVLVAVLIPLTKYVYNYFAAGAAYAAYVVAPPSLVGAYVSRAALLAGAGWALIAVFSLGQALQVLIMFTMLFLFAAAGRLLIGAALAALMPITVVLAAFPVQPVRRVGMRLLSVLTGFTFVPVVAAAILAVGANAFDILVPHGGYGPGTAGWWVNFVLATVMFFTALAAPLLAMLIVSEAGIGMAFASYAMMYVVRPAVRAASEAPSKAVKMASVAAGGSAGATASSRLRDTGE